MLNVEVCHSNLLKVFNVFWAKIELGSLPFNNYACWIAVQPNVFVSTSFYFLKFFLFKHIHHCLPQKHLGLSKAGADPGEVKRVNFHPPFSEPPSFFFLIPQILVLRPRLYGEKLSRVEGSPAYPSYPGRANFSYISLQNLANRLYEKQKVASARRGTRLAG